MAMRLLADRTARLTFLFRPWWFPSRL